MKILDFNTRVRRRLKNRGYVLLELLVTVVILTVGILYVIDSFRASAKATSRVLATRQAIDVGIEIRDRILTDPSGVQCPASGETRIGAVVYKWKLAERFPVELTPLSVTAWAATLRIDWNKPASQHIELPLLWSGS